MGFALRAKPPRISGVAATTTLKVRRYLKAWR